MGRAASIFLRGDVRPEDGKNLIRWVQNPRVTRYLNESAAAPRELQDMLLSTSPGLLTCRFNRDGRFYLVCDGQDDSVGFIKLRPNPGGPMEVVYVIGEEGLWGQGLGKQALRLALSKAFFDERAKGVVARIHRDNSRSLHTAAHWGMVQSATAGDMRIFKITLEQYLSRISAP